MKRKIIKILFIIGTFIFSLNALAWDSTGHRLIAAIAYQQLTPAARQQIDALTKTLDPDYPALSRFYYAATWADQIRNQDINAFNSWHFINYPFSVDGTPGQPPDPENVVWAINQSQQVLASTKASQYEKSIFLRFLLHFVGDVHQPLHCVQRYSKAFPNGDRSGNLVPINNRYAPNLHAYWDQGLGAFRLPHKRYPLSNKQITQLAAQLSATYPRQYFGARINDMQPADWAKESFQLAAQFVYNVPANRQLTQDYIQQGQKITAEQIVLAGYRLANALNQLYTRSN